MCLSTSVGSCVMSMVPVRCLPSCTLSLSLTLCSGHARRLGGPSRIHLNDCRCPLKVEERPGLIACGRCEVMCVPLCLDRTAEGLARG